MKRILSLFIALTMLLSLGVTVSAEGESVIYSYNTHADKIKVYANSGNGNTPNGMCSGLSVGGSAFFTTDAEPGAYLVSVEVATNDAAAKLTGWIEKESGQFTTAFTDAYPFPHTGWTTFKWFDMGITEITAEKKIIGLSVSGQFLRIKSIKLTPVVVDLSYDAIVGSEQYTQGASYSRASDAIVIDYDGNIDINSDTKAVLRETDTENYIATQLEVSGSKLTVAFKNTLDYGKEYTLTLSGVLNANMDVSMSASEFTFRTNDEASENTGNDTAVISSFELNQGKAHIEGVINGSQNVGISGRNIKWYLTLPAQEKTLVKENVFSGEDGKFSLDYTLPEDDVMGTVYAEIESEYATAVTEDFYYVSDKYVLSEIKEIEGTSDWTQVRDIIEENETKLGFNLSEELAGLDEEAFYEHFVGVKITTVENFKKQYNQNIIIERVNTATQKTDIENIFASPDVYKLFEIDEDILSYISGSEDIFYDGLLAEVKLNDNEDFDKALKSAYNEAILHKECISDISLISDTLSVKRGETTVIELNTTASFENTKEMTVVAKFSGCLENYAEGLEFSTELGDFRASIDNESASIVIKSDSLMSGDKIGTLTFVSGKAGEGMVTISGSAVVDTSIPYDAEIVINEEEFDISVAEQVKKPIGGSGSSFGGGSYVSKPSQTATQDVEKEVINTETKKVFEDLAEAPWAEQYIMALYNIQAINKNEEARFYPQRNITRAEFLKIVVLANDLPKSSYVDYDALELDFNDVSKDAWYYQYLQAAVYNKIITGDGNGNFRPDDYITRQDICVILGRLGKMDDSSVDSSFADDGEISDYAKTAVYTMKKNGVVNGIGDNRFAPKANATRAEAAKIICGMIK